jgi:hypothetical protein
VQTRCPWCNNKFHRQCIEEWIAKSSKCPLCMRPWTKK